MILGRLFGTLLRKSRRKPPTGRSLWLLEQGESALKAADIGAASAAFDQALAAKPRNAALRYRIATAYLAVGSHAAAQSELERCIELDPSFAQAYVRLGSIDQLRGDAEAAERRYRKAIELDPAVPIAHCNLAVLLVRQARARDALRHFHAAHGTMRLEGEMLREFVQALVSCQELDEAAEIAREAVEAAPADPVAWFCEGLICQKRHRYAEALAAYDRALAIKPADADLFTNRAVSLQELGRLPEAFADYDRALALRPGDPLARFHKGLASLLTADYAAAWPDYESRLLSDDVPERPLSYPRWQGEALYGRTILIYGEQGLGDEIMFASCVPDVLRAGARCVIECRAALRGIFAHSFPEATVYASTPDRQIPEEVRALGIDWQVPIGSLPLHYRKTPGDFPRHSGYLKARTEHVAAWRARLEALGHGPKVGISWRGGTYRSRQPLRSIALERWLPILKLADLDFVSLQYTEDAPSDVAALFEAHGVRVMHWPEAIADYEETAALVSALDLTVTVCTSVGHLAGALGRPVWVMAPYVPEWRYGLRGERLPWYPSARVFRQRSYGQWQDVIDDVARRLAGGIER